MTSQEQSYEDDNPYYMQAKISKRNSEFDHQINGGQISPPKKTKTTALFSDKPPQTLRIVQKQKTASFSRDKHNSDARKRGVPRRDIMSKYGKQSNQNLKEVQCDFPEVESVEDLMDVDFPSLGEKPLQIAD